MRREPEVDDDLTPTKLRRSTRAGSCNCGGECGTSGWTQSEARSRRFRCSRAASPFDEAMSAYRRERSRAADVRIHLPAGHARTAAARDAAVVRRHRWQLGGNRCLRADERRNEFTRGVLRSRERRDDYGRRASPDLMTLPFRCAEGRGTPSGRWRDRRWRGARSARRAIRSADTRL